jgi:hypothetical protein
MNVALSRALPMDDPTMKTAATVTMNPVTRDSLAATVAELKARLGPMPRDVFLYPGPIDRFLADLAASGVEIRGPEVAPPGAVPSPFGLPPIGSLEFWEIGGNVWVAGRYRDVEDARDGKIPFKWLRPGPG